MVAGMGRRHHHVNKFDRTALMEAALWGRYKKAEYMSEQGVDLDIRDGNGMQAVDLSTDSSSNA